MAAQDSVTASVGTVERKESKRGKKKRCHLSEGSQTPFRLDSGWSAVPWSLGAVE